METLRFSSSTQIQNRAVCWKGFAVGVWDAQGKILTDYLQKGQCITGAYYKKTLLDITSLICATC